MSNSVPLVVGSVAYDYIINLVIGTMRNQLPIVDGKLPANLSMAFVGSDSIIRRGGTGGNIAYGLGLLKNLPVLMSAAGTDFDRYEKEISKFGVTLAVDRNKNRDTAHCYMITDKNREQIIIWQSNAYEDVGKLNLNETLLSNATVKQKKYEYPIAIFSPGGSHCTPQHIHQFHLSQPKSMIIFDPGQMVMSYASDLFAQTVAESNIIILNDSELAKVNVNHKLTNKKLFDLGIEWIIETKGAQGSTFHHNDGEKINIGIAKPREFVEPTGAGDAYRAGLIHGLMMKCDMATAGKYGAAMASFCLEVNGGQGYTPSIDEINKRKDSVPLLQ